MKINSIIIILLIITLVSGCGGGGMSGIPSGNNDTPQATPSPVQSEGGIFAVTVYVPFNGADEIKSNDLSASVIPWQRATIKVTITGDDVPVEQTQTVTGGGPYNFTFNDVKAGLKVATISAIDSIGKVLAQRKHGFLMTSGDTVNGGNLSLGVTIDPNGLYQPQNIEIPVGTTLYFENQDTVNNRTVTLLPGPITVGTITRATASSPPYNPAVYNSASYTFNTPGTYTYQGTTGKIVVYGTSVPLPEMALIQGGQQFGMVDGGNDPNAAYKVTLSPYYMGKYEVTNTEYVRFLNEMGNLTEGGVTWINIVADAYCGIQGNGPYSVIPGYGNRPVVYVSWYGSVAYCNWLSGKHGLSPCYGNWSLDGYARWGTFSGGAYTDMQYYHPENSGYRLPTEAEWEYAGRGGDPTLTNFYKNYYWGNSMDNSKCWWGANGQGGPADTTDNHTNIGYGGGHPAGLYDMSGNVWEWCGDWYDNYPSGSYNDYKGPVSWNPGIGAWRVIRGGSWWNGVAQCQPGVRATYNPDNRSLNVGFRLVRKYY